MSYELQIKLREDPKYKKYLRENSIWYKRLIRHPESFQEFKEAMRRDYHLRPSDRFSQAMDTFDIITNLLKNMV